jgi:lipoate-protein ligase A
LRAIYIRRMFYIQSPSVDPAFNLALEQHVFDKLDPGRGYFMLWQNANAVIVGRHQNTIAEINAAYVRERDITVVRRLSGGGAVYHDLGNLNFTFIADGGDESFDFSTFCKPMAGALRRLGAPVEISGRNDMTIAGKKISGNAQYMKRGRVMHHGTLLYDTDLLVMSRALNVAPDKIESKGIRSVQSRVANIKPYLSPASSPASSQDRSVAWFRDALRDFMFKERSLRTYDLTPDDLAAVDRLRATVYSRWDWNYGQSPAYSICKERRVEGCGTIAVHMDVSEGRIEGAAFYGDYFGNGDSTELARRLHGAVLEEDALRQALADTDIGLYFNNLDLDGFVSILLR